MDGKFKNLIGSPSFKPDEKTNAGFIEEVIYIPAKDGKKAKIHVTTTGTPEGKPYELTDNKKNRTLLASKLEQMYTLLATPENSKIAKKEIITKKNKIIYIVLGIISLATIGTGFMLIKYAVVSKLIGCLLMLLGFTPITGGIIYNEKKRTKFDEEMAVIQELMDNIDHLKGRPETEEQEEIESLIKKYAEENTSKAAGDNFDKLFESLCSRDPELIMIAIDALLTQYKYAGVKELSNLLNAIKTCIAMEPTNNPEFGPNIAKRKYPRYKSRETTE